MTYDVFLSHNSREKPSVQRLAVKLRECGLNPWLDAWHVIPGGRWQDDLADGLKASKSCAVFVGPHDAGDWEREEVGVALDLAAKNRIFRIFLVLLPGTPEPFDASTLSPFLSTRTWVDLRKGIEQDRSFQALVNAIQGVPLALPATVETSPSVCPYRGLQPFDLEHAEFYFGRDGEIQRLVEQLKSSRFLAVLGPSGSGKSSLVRAGLIPALNRGELPGGGEWPVHVFTPGADPLTQLAAQLVRSSGVSTMAQTLDHLSADPRTLHLGSSLALTDHPSATLMVWVVDQFEEIFTLCRSEQARAAFIANLMHASAPEGRAIIVITLRADFYHRCADFADLSARVASNQFLVSPMDNAGLRQAIDEPARLAGLEFEEGLVDTILEDVGGQADALPLLEHALLELWERRRGRLLTLEGYRASGGLQGAIARRAESIYDSLDERGKTTSRQLLLRLTQVGEGTEDTRRRAEVSELATTTVDAPIVEGIIQRWTDARLLTTTSGEDRIRYVTVSHEALIRVWPRLRKWIDEDRAGQRLHRQITEAAQDWRALARDDSALLRGLRLAQSTEFRAGHQEALNELEREFLDASVALQRREAAQRERGRRRLVLGLSLGIIGALSLAALAGWQWRRAEREQQRAAVQTLNARSDLLRTRALAIAPGWPDFLQQSGLLALEARRLQSDIDTGRGLRAAADALGRSTREIPLHISLDKSFPGFSPPRDEVAVASADRRSVHLIQLSTGETVHSIPAAGAVVGSAYSPRGSHLAVFTESHLEVWRLDAGGPRKLWTQPAGPLSGIARAFPGSFSPDETAVAWISGTSALVAETASGRQLHRLDHSDDVAQIAFSRDGLKLASGGGKMAQVLTLSTGGIQRITHDERMQGVALDGHGRLLATVDGRFVDVWDVSNGNRVAHIAALPGGDDVEHVVSASLDATGFRVGIIGEYGTAVQFGVSPVQQLWQMNYTGDDRQLASLTPPFVTAKTQPGVEVWDATEGRPLARVLHKGPLDDVIGVSFSTETRRLVLLGSDRMWAYDTSPGSEVARATFDLSHPVLRSGDRRLLGFREGSALRVVDASSARQLTRIDLPVDTVDVAMIRDGSLLLVRTRADTAAVIAVADGRDLWRRDNIGHARFSPEGRHIIASHLDDTLRVWDVQSGTELWRQTGIPAKVTQLDKDDDEVLVVNVRAVVFGPSADRFALRFGKGGARGWELATGREMSKEDAGALAATETAVTMVGDLTTDGNHRAVVESGEVRVVSADGKQVISTVRHDGDLVAERNYVSDVRFSRDGRYLVTGGGDRTARVWDLTGRELTRITLDERVEVVAFSDDARYITTLTADGALRTWLWQDADLIGLICQRLTRNLSASEWQTHFGATPYRPTCPGLLKPE